LAKRLTAKQNRFVLEYFVDFNAKEAAIRAGYSKKTARSIGSENLSKPYIQEAIQELAQKTAKKLDITRDSVMRELAAVGFARLPDFVRVETKAENNFQIVRIIDTDDLPEDKVAALASIKQTTSGIEVKLHDKIRALETIGRALGMFDSRDMLSAMEIEDLTPLAELLSDDDTDVEN